MNVADLQQLLDNVGRLLATAGAKAAPLAELTAFREGLAPFQALSLKKLTELLTQADAAARGAPAAPGRGRRSRGSSTDRPDPETMMREVKALYERATDPLITETDIEAVLARLKPLTKDALLSVATGIELKVLKSKSKDSILGEIRQRILARRSVHQRSQLLGHPGEAADEAQAGAGKKGSGEGEAPHPAPRAFPAT